MQDSLKDKLKNLSPDQIRKLLASRGKSRGGAVKKEFEKMPRNSEGRYPLSRAQERIWFLSYLFKNSSLYNIPIAVKLYKDVSAETLRIALEQAVIKNEILRTTFHEEEGSVFQKIHATYTPTLSYEDISTNANKDEEVERIALEHSSVQFDLTELPLFAAKLVKLAQHEFVLFLNLQHIISDGWTNALLSNDLNLDPQTARLSPTKEYGYIDFVKWEQDWMRSDTYKEQVLFWKERLSDLPTSARFAKDFYGGKDSYKGSLLVYDFPDETWQKIHTFCKNNNYTAFQFFLVCFAVLTSVYTQEKDLIIGTPVANRNASYFHKTYGLFFNSLPMRLLVDIDVSFYELMRRSIEDVNQYMKRQEVPFTEIIKAVNPKRNLEENVLFNTHFAYQHFPKKNKEDEYAMLPIDYKTSKFDVNLWVEVAGDDCKLSLTYKNERISKQKIERFLEHYQNLIDAVIDDPETLISKHSIVPENELSILSGKTIEYAEESWLTLFNTSLKKSPNAVAVIDSNEEITYSELNRKANALAEVFKRKGIHKGEVIIIDTGRSIAFIVGILASFKMRCAYLPIASNTPEERLNYIIKDSQASAIFADKEVENMVCVSPKELVGDAQDNDAITTSIEKEDTAYIIYTSGTTGKPKGVKVSHGALLNYTKSMEGVINDDQLRTFAHVSAVQADLGNTSIFLALASSGTLLLPSEDVIVDPLLMRNFFKAYPADVLKIVPSHLEAFSEQMTDVLPNHLLICGGEAMSNSLIEKLKKSGVGALRILNHYGPTETTIGVLTHAFDMHKVVHPIPVGKPLYNTTIHLMDDRAQTVPIGVEGEIYIGGSNLASGYLNDDALTSEKFVHIEGNNYYRTGDRGILNNEKELIFLGRSDSQVKINGFRVELREIEHLLKAHESIDNACVFLNNKARICAAVQSSKGITSNTITAYMKRHVSELFIPDFSFVEHIPLTSNGKVDYQYLKELSTIAKKDAVEALPRDLYEIKLLEFYTELFPNTKISVEDSFFDVGGHSLLAIQLMSKINTTFKSKLVIANLFSHSSVKELAGLLRGNTETLAGTENPIALVNNRQEQKSIWIHPAGGNIMCYYPIATALSSTMDTFSFDYEYPKNNNARSSVQQLGDRYFSALQQKKFTSNLFLAGWSMGALIAHQMACLFAERNVKVPLVLLDQPATSSTNEEVISYKDRLFTYLNKVHIFTNGQFDKSIIEKDSIDHEGILNEFIRVQLTPEETTLENFKVFLDTLVMHNEIVTEFIPGNYEGPVLLLKASEHLMVDENPMAQMPDLGWGDYCSDLTIMHVPGNHITMMNTENSKVIANTIQEWLQKQATI